MNRLVRCHECEYWDPDREFDSELASWEPADRAEVKFGLCRANPPTESVMASDKVIDLYEATRLTRYLAMPPELREQLMQAMGLTLDE